MHITKKLQKFQTFLCNVHLKKTFFFIFQGCTETKTNSNFINCTDTEFRCLNKFYCIHKTWLCDGDTDCPDGSDESVQICGTSQKCRSDQFTCDNGACIPGHLQCSGNPECSDGSDEKMCSKFISFLNCQKRLLYLAQLRGCPFGL